MKQILALLTILLLMPLAVIQAAESAQGKANLPGPKLQTADNKWQEPPIVEPKYDGILIPPPHGAVVLFDGQNASGWVAIPNKKDTSQSSQYIWKVENGYMEVVTPLNSRDQRLVGTKESPITSGHLHIEWATPAEVKGTGQGRGNSGVFIEGFPELQVLNSFNNPTYFDGQAAALYKYRPPLVNASRGPGLWQCYDIYIQRAKVDGEKVIQPAVITVYHNNVLVQDHLTFSNPIQASTLRLQDHLNPLRFRNIWFMPGGFGINGMRGAVEDLPKNGEAALSVIPYETGFVPLFDGKTLNGWTSARNTGGGNRGDFTANEAEKAGMKYFSVDLEGHSLPPLESVQKCLEFLNNAKYIN